MEIIEEPLVAPSPDPENAPLLPDVGRSGNEKQTDSALARDANQKKRISPNTRQSRPPKRRGEAAELAFMHKAIDEGFAIAKPWGDSERYDFILDNGQRLWRVQVRSTDTPTQYGGFVIRLDRRVRGIYVPLTPRDVDVIVAYVIPRKAWYIVPIEEAVSVAKYLCFGKTPRGDHWEQHREDWDYLRAKQIGQAVLSNANLS
jgi:hypothetical protein